MSNHKELISYSNRMVIKYQTAGLGFGKQLECKLVYSV